MLKSHCVGLLLLLMFHDAYILMLNDAYISMLRDTYILMLNDAYILCELSSRLFNKDPDVRWREFSLSVGVIVVIRKST